MSKSFELIMPILTDIRPGNKVLYNTSGIFVTVLNVNSDVIELESFPGSIYCASADVSGIQLTGDMLHKLLFSNDAEPDKWSGQGISIQKKPDGFYYGLRIEKNRSKIEYLHQLQNYVQDFNALFREINYSLNITTL